MVLIPIGCMAVGLWMQHHNAARAIRQALEEKLWDRMAPAVSMLEEPALSGSQRDALLSEAAEALAEPAQRLPGGVLLVDGQSRVVARFPADNGRSTDQGVIWHPHPVEGAGDGGATRGFLELADGMHYAIRLADSGGEGSIFVHHPTVGIERDVAALTRSLPAISAMTLVWCSAMLTIAVFLVLGKAHERDESQRVRSTADTLRQAKSLARTQDAVIFGLAKLADSRDSDTGDHLDRISAYSTLLAITARQHSRLSGAIDSGFVRLIGISSALHDIGKVGIEDDILLKPGPLTPAERGRMQEHSVIGGECLRSIEQRLGSSNFLQMAREIAFAHHERWDGGGYPSGLSGEAIPLAARIVAIADVYDALASKRVYKQAFEHQRCVEIIREAAGTQFDPELVEIWLTVESKFRDIARQFAGRPEAPAAHEFTLTPSDAARDEEPLAVTRGS